MNYAPCEVDNVSRRVLTQLEEHQCCVCESCRSCRWSGFHSTPAQSFPSYSGVHELPAQQFRLENQLTFRGNLLQRLHHSWGRSQPVCPSALRVHSVFVFSPAARLLSSFIWVWVLMKLLYSLRRHQLSSCWWALSVRAGLLDVFL